VAEAAAHLGVAEAFVRRLVLQRRVRFYKVGRYVRFRTADLNAFVDAGRHDPVEIDTHDLVGQARPNGATTGRGVTATGSTARRRGVVSRGN
jgi:excisionase family DNA binding protein